MTDNKLRSVVIYRIDPSLESAAVTMVAKYDHASSCEVHDSSTDGGLYGSREKDYAEAVGMVVTNDPPGAANEAGKVGGFKVVQSEMHQVVYGADSEGLCIAVITGLAYPSRTVTQLVVELHGDYNRDFGQLVKTAEPGSLNQKSKRLLSAICTKYENVKSVDKASALSGKVDEVKVQMQDNIADMLNNIEKSESISNQADQLNEQASVFKKKSTQLKKQMRCKNLKMTIIFVVLIVGVLLVIIIPLVIKSKKDKD